MSIHAHPKHPDYKTQAASRPAITCTSTVVLKLLLDRVPFVPAPLLPPVVGTAPGAVDRGAPVDVEGERLEEEVATVTNDEPDAVPEGGAFDPPALDESCANPTEGGVARYVE